jgi:HD-GYP domain-containing protein (c-di-GMP phosphodiesterase class II)
MQTKNKFIPIIYNIILYLVGLISGFFFLFGIIEGPVSLLTGKYPEFWDFFFSLLVLFFYGFTSYWCLKLAFTRGISTKRKREEEEHRQTIDSLRTAFGATIRVMVSAVESRDPYTAGHQIRSADLARAIATEMELSPDKIDGIRVAGSTHDIGKLSIPEEILSKPTNLSEMEFSLIKEHTQKGHEILKNVESPWPLAEIVYQHHERMDGSGYPRNLKGEEILIEARILAVADVVEAMASHRPYHPGLGIDAALEEIEKNKGILYDGTVADACLRLFREKGFKLEGT